MSRIYVTEPGATGGVGATGMRVLVQALRAEGHDVTRVRLFRDSSEVSHQTSLFGATDSVTSADQLRDRPDAWFVSVLYVRQFLDLADMFRRMGLALRTEHRSSSDPLVAFGGQFSFAPEPLADVADIIALGDGELTGGRIAQMLGEGAGRLDIMRALAGVRGYYVPSIGPRRLERLEGESYSAVTVEDGRTPTIELARGCKSKCSFCRIGWAGGTYREAPIEQVEREIRRVGKHAVNIFAPDYSSVSYVDQVESVVAEAGCRNTGRDARADATWRLLQRDGAVKSFSFGIEGASTRLRAAIGKPLAHDRLVETMGMLSERGVRVAKWYVILGFPGETSADLAEMIEALEATRAVFGGALSVTPTLLQPTPHTPMERLSARYNAEAWERAMALREWARAAAAKDGRNWIVAQPKGSELHEFDCAMTRAGRSAVGLIETSKGESEIRSGRWRGWLDDSLLDEISPDSETEWSHVEGPTREAKEGGMVRYWRAMRRLPLAKERRKEVGS